MFFNMIILQLPEELQCLLDPFDDVVGVDAKEFERVHQGWSGLWFGQSYELGL